MQSIPVNPRDDFSNNLLRSIPTKTIAWLKNLGRLKNQKGTIGPLSWRIRNNNGKSYIQINDVRIEWMGTHSDIYYVNINQGWATDITHNMDKFVALEKSIYDEIEKLEKEILEAQKMKIEIPSRDRILQTLQTS